MFVYTFVITLCVKLQFVNSIGLFEQPNIHFFKSKFVCLPIYTSKLKNTKNEMDTTFEEVRVEITSKTSCNRHSFYRQSLLTVEPKVVFCLQQTGWQ